MNEILEEVKEQLGFDVDIEPEEERNLLTLIKSARAYIKNSTGYKEPVELTEQNQDLFEEYKLSILLLVTHWHENREPTGKAEKLAFSLNSIFQHLRWCNNG